MRKGILFLIVYFLLLNQALAQTNLPPAFEIKTDTAFMQVVPDSLWQILEDKEGDWTIENVSKPPLFDQFHYTGVQVQGIDTNKIHTYWQRFRLKNDMNIEAKISLTAPVDYYDVYIINNDSVPVHYRSGLLQDWDKKDGLKAAFISGAISFVIKPGSETIIYTRINRVNTTNYKRSLSLYNTGKLIQQQYIDKVESRATYFGKTHLQESFVLGLLLLAIFLNIFFYRIVHEKVYLYFALFALFLGINRLWNLSSIYTLWEHPAWREYVPILAYAWAFIPYYLIQFFRQFLQTKMHYPKWDKFLYSLAVANILVHVLQFVCLIFFSIYVKYFYNILSILPFLLIPVCIIITFLFFIHKKDRPTRYLIVGALPLMLLYLVTSPSAIFGIKVPFIDNVIMQNFRLIEVICVTWLVVSFSLILLLRFDNLVKENAQKSLENERLAKEKEIEKSELIEKQKAELEIQVTERTADLKRSIEELKSTQSQLIQSEKMASLGELTAGIAHEIQNPLNFVNNFSEVSNELIDEMNEELNKGDIDEAKIISNDIKQNLEKINHHGKRADAIVKGMLQHSQTSKGQKEPTDINALCDEYLRLSYHGIRAKDNSFNAALQTGFDAAVGKINIIPQDIGRVILNLITNAFYSVDEKRKSGSKDYVPTVIIKTKKAGNRAEIVVADNGNGIPQTIIDKIFQPFFTTKPTGQGTGLGLSLSYDIVKAHGGEIKVESKDGEGTSFTISLPVA